MDVHPLFICFVRLQEGNKGFFIHLLCYFVLAESFCHTLCVQGRRCCWVVFPTCTFAQGHPYCATASLGSMGTEWDWTGMVEIQIGQRRQLFGFAMIFFCGWSGTIDPSGVYFDIANLAVARKHNEFWNVFTFKYGHQVFVVSSLTWNWSTLSHEKALVDVRDTTLYTQDSILWS